MDKFVIRKRNRDPEKSDPGESSNSQPCVNVSVSATNVIKKSKLKVRKYKDDYLKFGFSWIGNEDYPQPKCVVCGMTLSNQSMVPNKLQRHLQQHHKHVEQKPAGYFKGLLQEQTKASKKMQNRVKISDKALIASFKVSELIARNKKGHTIGETLILPACKEIVNIMFGPEAAEEVSKIALSNDTVKRRIQEMSVNIEDRVCEMLRESKKFALQLDESTDVSGRCQLIAFVRFVDGTDIIEQILFCRELTTTTTGADIFSVVNTYLQQQNLTWQYCCSLCTDGAAAMTGRIKGFISFVKKENPAIVTTHCFLHRQALMAKSVEGGLLNEVFTNVVAMINFIKTRPVKSRLFEKLCEEMGAEYKTLLLHSEIRWLSRGKILHRVLQLQEEMKIFFETQKLEFSDMLSCATWKAKLAYLADIFEKLNLLNTSMQGQNENIISANDKMNGFSKKLNLWRSAVERGDLSNFAFTTKSIADLEQSEVVELRKIIINHLNVLQDGLKKYFPSVSTIEMAWVVSPFEKSGEININNPSTLTAREKEELVDINSNTALKSQFLDSDVSKFWISLKKDYPSISEKALDILLPFATSYLCEMAFSSMKQIKSKYRARLTDVDSEMRVSLSRVRPQIEKLCSTHQAQVSH